MRERGISPAEVEECLQSPDFVERRNSLLVAQKRLNKYVLRVVFKRLDDEALVVTAYKSSKRKYFRVYEREG